MVDGVILDLMLENESGFDLLDKIQQTTDFACPPIIIYTAKNLTVKEQNKLEAYASAIILKGEHASQRLLDEVELFLNRVNHPLIKQPKLSEPTHSKKMNLPKILMVDDDGRNLFSLKQILSSLDVTLLTANNGQEAVMLFEKNPDMALILMDMMMPVVNGYDATQAIRNLNKKVPIIALTAKAMKDDRERCLAAGCTDYLSKPVDVNQLLSLVHIWLKR